MKDITVSPATSNEGVEVQRSFEGVFGASTLQDAFERHPAFGAVFKGGRARHFDTSRSGEGMHGRGR